MDRKTLTGFILIGAILLLWPSYRNLISPQEKKQEELVVPQQSLVEEYSETSVAPNENIQALKDGIELNVVEVNAGLFTTKISNARGGSFVSYELSDHLKQNEPSLNLIDNINPANLVVSFIDQGGSVVVLDKNWILKSEHELSTSKHRLSTSKHRLSTSEHEQILEFSDFGCFEPDITDFVKNL